MTRDDRMLRDLSGFEGREVVVTVKMDGENTTMYRDGIHARSLSYTPHPSRTYVRRLHALLKQDIPVGWRVTGENLYARHSIAYANLDGYFLVFGIYDGDVALAWDEVEEYAAMLCLPTVPVLWRGIWDEDRIRQLYRPTHAGDPMEGYVVRPADAFPARLFGSVVAKYVRAGHVQTDEHWLKRAVVRNELGPKAKKWIACRERQYGA